MNISEIKSQFPLLQNYPDLAYLDTAATSQKPKSVIQAIARYYELENANIHRGVYRLSAEATEKYENSREKVRSFLNAKSSDEIIFVRGVTEAINLVAQTFGKIKVSQEDVILLTEMEHHSNIVPWQLLSESCGATIKTIPVLDNGELDIEKIDDLLTNKVKILSLVHVSNTLGTVNPIKKIISKAKAKGVFVIVDGAQAASHLPIDVQDLECDFYAFSGHKVYGPTGIGVLYGKKEHLENMPPYHGGGDMIESVSFQGSTYKGAPQKFEAGTPNICDAIVLAEAISFIESIGWASILEHEKAIFEYAQEVLNDVPNIKLMARNDNSLGAISFNLNGIHPHDVGTILDAHNIAIRAGHHCTQPLMKRFCLSATVRASFGVYNTKEDLQKLGLGLRKVQEIIKR